MDPSCEKTADDPMKVDIDINSQPDKGKTVIYDLDDMSTESDETLKENTKLDNEDVTSSFRDMHDSHSSSSQKQNAGGCEFLAHEPGDNIGLGKSCSCSFCLKARHMWMDLTMQDTRGRLTELQKSKKRASDQIARINREASALSKSTKVEFDLMQNWKTIFTQTHDALAQQINQTKSELEMRSKLVENCKRELETKCGSSNAKQDKPS